MKGIILFILLAGPMLANAQSNDELAIRKVLDEQTSAWNSGNVEGFMQGYWKSDSLMFIGKNGVSLGWQTALKNYRKNYPDTAAMGKLSFEIILVKRLSNDYYYVVGKWQLTRSIGNIGGHYDLLFRKVDGKWLIIADHTS